MIQTLIIEKATEEIERRNFGVTEQFLEIHQIAYSDGKPKIARVDVEKEGEAIVYFHVEDEDFFFAVYLDLSPEVSVRWVETEPFHSVYFAAFTDKFSLDELRNFTKLKIGGGWNKGDKRTTNPDAPLLKESSIYIEPNPEADEFEDKLTKLLEYLEQDQEGILKLANEAGGYIQVYSEFHNGNTMLGGYNIDKEQIRRMSALNLEISVGVRATGNLFPEPTPDDESEDDEE